LVVWFGYTTVTLHTVGLPTGSVLVPTGLRFYVHGSLVHRYTQFCTHAVYGSHCRTPAHGSPPHGYTPTQFTFGWFTHTPARSRTHAFAVPHPGLVHGLVHYHYTHHTHTTRFYGYVHTRFTCVRSVTFCTPRVHRTFTPRFRHRSRLVTHPTAFGLRAHTPTRTRGYCWVGFHVCGSHYTTPTVGLRSLRSRLRFTTLRTVAPVWFTVLRFTLRSFGYTWFYVVHATTHGWIWLHLRLVLLHLVGSFWFTHVHYTRSPRLPRSHTCHTVHGSAPFAVPGCHRLPARTHTHGYGCYTVRSHTAPLRGLRSGSVPTVLDWLHTAHRLRLVTPPFSL